MFQDIIRGTSRLSISPFSCYLFIAWTLVSVNAVMAMSPAEQRIQTDRPLVIAHRGYSMIAPENTLPAFGLAKLAGADLIELDYYVSRDGVPMVFHDATLDRTTNAVAEWGREGLTIADLNARVLQTLDVGSWFSEAYQGLRMPALVEALDLIQKDGGVTLIERKTGNANDLAELLTRHNLVDAVIVQAMDWEFLRELNELLPDLVLCALGSGRQYQGRTIPPSERILNRFRVDEAVKHGARVICWNRHITGDAVEYAHSKGLRVWIYTVNDEDLANRMLDLGVDGIISDNPPLIWQTLALRCYDKP